MKSLLVLLGLSAVASASRLPVPSDSINGENVADEFLAKSLFDKFKLDHHKSYHASEESHRYSIFRNNLGRIAELNEKNGSPAFGITPFADLTAQEFAKAHLGFKPQLDEESQQARLSTPVFELDEDADFPEWGANNTLVDWRQKGAVTKVKDQAQCGSCWAFSATEQIESAWYLAKGTLPVLSPQQIVSCDKTDAGCNGGDTPTAYAYVKKAGGLESEAAYPYTSASGNTGTCKFKASGVVAKISGFSYATPPCTGACKTQDEATFANNVAAKGPASICVNAEQWQLYSSGVLSKSACGGIAYTDLDHCVQLVGYNKPTSGKSYWIVRNSWGTSWGYSGYIYVEYGTNACGIADEATFVTI